MEDIELSMRALYIAKAFADAGKLERLIALCGDQLREDSYYEYISCAWEILCESVYINPKRNYEYDCYTTYIYLSDPVMVEFYRLCKEYGERHHLAEKENPYFKESISRVSACLDVPSYNYNFGIITGTAKKRSSGIIIVYDDDFCESEFLMEGILDALAYYKSKVNELKEVLKRAKIAPLPVKMGRRKEPARPVSTEKEAA